MLKKLIVGGIVIAALFTLAKSANIISDSAIDRMNSVGSEISDSFDNILDLFDSDEAVE